MSSCMPRWQECQEDFQSFFPEEASSRESWQLLVFSYRGTLSVGFGFAAAANPSTSILGMKMRAPWVGTALGLAVLWWVSSSAQRWV